MAAKKIIAVVGATGNQGGGVVSAFLATQNWTVRAITRNSSSDAAKALADKGAEVVQADLTDKSSLIKAFQGVHAIFLNTEFWSFYHPTRAQYDKEGKDVAPLSDIAFQRETSYGVNAVEAAATIPTLERFVYSALGPIAKATNGKHPRAKHSEAKAWIVEYIEGEQPSLAAKTSIIYAGVYNDNRMLAPRKDPSTGEFSLTAPLKEDTRVPLIDARVSVGKFVLSLVENERPGIKLLAYDSYLTVGQILQEWSKASGKEASFKYITTQYLHDTLKMPWELLDAADYLVDYGLEAGIPGLIKPEQLSTKVHTETFQQWLAKRDWNAVLSA